MCECTISIGYHISCDESVVPAFHNAVVIFRDSMKCLASVFLIQNLIFLRMGPDMLLSKSVDTGSPFKDLPNLHSRLLHEVNSFP